MNRQITPLFVLFLVSVTAQADDMARASIGDSELIAGGEAVISEPVKGNAFAAGGRVELLEHVERNAFISGGEVTLAGSVGRNLRAAGGTLRMTPDASVGRDATFAGGTIDIDGAIDGRLRAYGERIVVNGRVGGDVELAGDKLRIGPDARISGRVTYRSSNDIVVDPAAVVTGGVRRSGSEREWLDKVGRGATIAGGITISLGMLLLGAVLVLGMPRFSREAAATIRRKPWQSLGLGCVMLIGVPCAIAVLILTLIGIPLALLVVFAYIALLMLGYLVAAIFVGDQVLERMNAAKLDSVWWRAAFLVLAIIALALLRQVPVVGEPACLLLFLAGVGAFTMRCWQGFRNDPLTA